MEKKEIKQALREFNKEVTSISGCCKIILSFWGTAAPLMEEIGLKSKSSITPANIFKLVAPNLISDADGIKTCYIWVKEYYKDVNKSANGARVVTTYKIYKGKRIFKWVKKPITAWNVHTLFTLIEQSINGGMQPECPEGFVELYDALTSKAADKAASKAADKAASKAANKAASKAADKATSKAA